MCLFVSGRICVSLHVRNSGQVKVDGRKMCSMHLCVCFYVCVRVLFIKERVTAEEERKRDDPWLSSRGEMKKRGIGRKLREQKKKGK